MFLLLVPLIRQLLFGIPVLEESQLFPLKLIYQMLMSSPGIGEVYFFVCFFYFLRINSAIS